MRIPALVLCGRRADSYKKSVAFQKYPDTCGRSLKSLWRAISKICGFGVRIHWFRVDRRPIRIKKYAVSKVSGFVWKLRWAHSWFLLLFNKSMA